MASALLAAAIFAPSVRFDLLWDDPRLLNEALPALTDWKALLFPPPGVADFDRYYRPVAYGTLLLVNRIGGGLPLGFHVAGVALHALCAGLVAWLSLRVLSSTGAAFVGSLAAGLLFAVHPVHVETVAWAGAAMNELPAAACLLASLIAYEAARRRGAAGPYAAALLLALVAMSSKETAVAVVPLAAALELLPAGAGERRRSPAAWRVAGLALPLLVYLSLRRTALGGWFTSPSVTAEETRSLAALPAALLFYLERLVAPLSACHVVFELPTLGWAAASLLALFLVAGAAVCATGVRRHLFALPYGVGWVGIAVSPACALALYTVATLPLAERYAYVPSIGIALIAGGVMALAARWQRTAAAVLAVVLLVSAATTLRRQAVFASDAVFWPAARACAPGHCLPLIMIADQRWHAADLDGAEALYTASLDLPCIPQQRGLAKTHLGVCRYQRGDLDGAERWLKAARPLAPTYSLTPYLLARIAIARSDGARRRGDVEGTRAELEVARSDITAALELRPHNPEYLYAAGQVAYLLGDAATARRDLEEALRLAPQHEAANAARTFLANLAEEPAPH